MRTRPTTVLVLGRYMSGARLAVMLAAGELGCHRSRFLRISATSAILWGITTPMTGYLGGTLFLDQPVLGLLTAFAIGALVTVITQYAAGQTAARQPRHHTPRPTPSRTGMEAGARRAFEW